VEVSCTGVIVTTVYCYRKSKVIFCIRTVDVDKHATVKHTVSGYIHPLLSLIFPTCQPEAKKNTTVLQMKESNCLRITLPQKNVIISKYSILWV
jgi:hypothetical protein